METAITEGIKISVESNFRDDLSEVNGGSFFFNYHIFMENRNSFSVQLIHRDWFIFDSLDEANYVHGPGVIGEQPVLAPMETFSYTSGCELQSEIGFMNGFYTFLNLQTNKPFRVEIPAFHLFYPPKLN
jgi:ApaG protein